VVGEAARHAEQRLVAAPARLRDGRLDEVPGAVELVVQARRVNRSSGAAMSL
jgi:hypothetical protein